MFSQEMEEDSIDLRSYIQKPYEYIPDEVTENNDTLSFSNYSLSNGWFPIPVYFYFNSTFIYQHGFLYDRADDIRPKEFIAMASPFTSKYPWQKEARNIYEENNTESFDEDYPERSYNALGFAFRMGYYMPAIIRLHGTVAFTEGLLFAADNERSFLNHDSKIEKIQELGTIYLDEISLNAGAGIELPLWGWFVDALESGNYYYLFSELSYNKTISSELTQYSQILSPKDKIRYSNGMDTIQVIHEKELDGINKERYYIDAGFGVNLDIKKYGIDFEFFMSIPLSSVLKDDDWRQYMFGAKIGIHFFGFF